MIAAIAAYLYINDFQAFLKQSNAAQSFLKFATGGMIMTGIDSFSSLKQFTDQLEDQERLMPIVFVGHGSPMNGIESNAFSQRWIKLAQEIPTPNAVLVVSAHWFTKGTLITEMDFPPTIHDFGGFPQALFNVQYPAPGNPALARETASLIHTAQVTLSHDWGLDHGTWSVVKHMYPKATIPVLQLSIDYTKDAKYHYQLAKEIYSLRKKGVLIMGSGNMVHNLRMVAWDKLNEPEFGFDWAIYMNNKFKELISNGQHDSLIQYQQLGREALMAIPTPEHYLPLIYTLALKGEKDNIEFFNDKAVGGSLTMTSVKFA